MAACVRRVYGIPADIGKFTDSGMTDPDVGHKTFEAVLKRTPDDKEFDRLLERRRRLPPPGGCRLGGVPRLAGRR